MHRELLKLDMDHRIEPNLSGIRLIERMFIEDMTRTQFMDKVIKIRNVALYLMSVFREKFGVILGTSTSADGFSMYK